MALTRFKRTLPWARLFVRLLTHTLHLPPAHAEIYNGPHADWLREVLDRLPNLQSLVVRGLPFFDHAALCALRYKPDDKSERTNVNRSVPDGVIEMPAPISRLPIQRPIPRSTSLSTFGLRLLDASRCTNVTATGLCQALKRLDSLIYLDLSWTQPARDPIVLSTFRSFSGLQVLKLRGIALRDDGMEVLSRAIGTRVRSLDVRNNRLTDKSVRRLLESCFVIAPQNDSTDLNNRSAGVRSPSPLEYLGADMLAIYRGHEYDAYLRTAFTSSFVSRLAIEDAPQNGITHLYISENGLSVEGVSGLLRSGRLHVFDGSVDTLRPPMSPLTPPGKPMSDTPFPGAEKLIHVLAASAGHSLTYLKINHDLVTKRPPKMDEESVIPGRLELDTVEPRSEPQNDAIELDGTQQRHELDYDAMRIELDATPMVFELPTEHTPRYELPGDSIQMIVSPAIGEAPHATEQEQSDFAKARRGSAVAPEVVSPVTPGFIDSSDGSRSPGVSTMATLPLGYSNSLIPTAAGSPGTLNSAVTASSSLATSPTVERFSTGRPRTLSNVAAQRNTRMRMHLEQSDGFHPGLLPHLKVLVLTDVPPFSPDDEASERLVALIHECADEITLARQQARVDYTVPPGRKGLMATFRDTAKGFFALENVVLEMAQDTPQRRKSVGSAWRHDATRSMTNDRDSEALWSASETDFSFFGEGEECGLPSLETRHNAPFMAAMEQKEFVSDMDQLSLQKSRTSVTDKVEEAPRVDTIAKLSQFRKLRRQVYQMRVSMGETDPDVEGYWPGVVKVVRPSGEYDPYAADDEAVDYYGNRFSTRGVYR